MNYMPLTEKVTFTSTLERFDKVQIPKLIRWRFKMEGDQALKVAVNFLDLRKGWQFFYAKMRKDRRITVPNSSLTCLANEKRA